MRDIELLLPRVMVKAPTCPEPLALRCLRDAARVFARRSRLWRQSDTLTLAMRDCESLPTGENSEVFEFEVARFDTWNLKPVTLDWLNTETPGWRDEEGSPGYITQVNPGELRIAPKAAGTLKLVLILEPRETATALPNFMVERFGPTLAAGALAEILTTPGSFENPQLGLEHRRQFEEALDEWGTKASRGQQRATRRTRADAYF